MEPILDTEKITSYLYIVIPVVVIGLIALFALIGSRKKQGAQGGKWNTRTLTMAAICIALGFALSYIRIVHLPQGGSVTPASMLPLMLFAYLYGPRKGFLACMAYGLLQLLQDPYIVHWAQAIVDYLFAFMALGLAGIFSKARIAIGKSRQLNTILPGIVLAALGRYICHTASGIIFFAVYAEGTGLSVFAYSAGYNVYVLVEGALCLVLMLIPQMQRFALARRLEVRGG
ncbi:MAG: energy-coupled thiamine transporter ThiT [Christensenellales bacterium]